MDINCIIEMSEITMDRSSDNHIGKCNTWTLEHTVPYSRYCGFFCL